MSNDLNITRPTSRVIRAPGGSSAGMGNVLGSHTNETVAKPATPSELAPVEEAEIEIEIKEVPPTGTIGVIVAGTIASEEIKAAIVKALVLEGLSTSNITISTVADMGVLPYATLTLAKTVNIVIASSVVAHDPHGVETQALTTALLNIGIQGTVPVVPALINLDSLLEVKALLPVISVKWAKIAYGSLKLSNDSAIAIETPAEPDIPVTIVHTAAIDDKETLLHLLRESLKEHGARGIIGIGRKFRIVDDDKSGTIDLSEFTKMISEHAFLWTDAQIKIVFSSFDKDKSGSINYDEFLVTLRGELNDRRHQLVLMAFEILDADKSGVVEINDISEKYNGKKHPDVISGKRTEESVLREFLDTFDSPEGKDGKVTTEEFCNYYSNVSASIDDDDYFELMIRNAWHISGGEGWCANSSCRRVLVIHTDGRQTVEEIKNDIGMKADDKEAMMKNLVAQGITDIQSIELKGSTAAASTPEPVAAPAAPTKVAGIKPPHEQAPFVPPKSASKFNPRREPGGASSIIFG